jgi:hypothetical protein
MAVALNDANTSQGHTSSSTALSVTAGTWYDSSNRPVGDLLVAIISVTSNNIALSGFTPPSGWTLLTTVSIANRNYNYIIYRVVSGTITGGFTATLTSATAQIASYGITVLQYTGAGSGANIQVASQTVSSANMTVTVTPTYSNCVGIGYVSDIVQATTLTFSGTQPTWSSGGAVGLATSDTSGQSCYTNSDDTTATASGSGTAIANVSTPRTYPVFIYLLVPPGTNSFTNSPSDTVSTFSESRTATRLLQKSASDTVTTFSESKAQQLAAKNNPTDTALTFIDARASTQSVHQGPAQTASSFASTPTQTLSAHVAKSDTVSTFSDSPSAQIVKLATASDTATTFTDAKTVIASDHKPVADTGVAFSDSVAVQYRPHSSNTNTAASSDTVSNFSSTPLISVTPGAISSQTSIFANTDRSGIISTANVPQTLMLANATRSFWRIQNRSRYKLYFDDTGNNASTNPANGSTVILPGCSFWTQTDGNSPTAISIAGSVAGQAFTALETTATLPAGNTSIDLGITFLNNSSFITTANSAQTVQVASANVCYLRFQNLSSKSIWLSDTHTAGPYGAGSYEVKPYCMWETPVGGASNKAYSIAGYPSTAGQVYSCVVGFLTGKATTINDYSNNIYAGGNVQPLIPVNANRKGWKFQNISAFDMWYNDTNGSAYPNVPGSYRVRPGGYVEFSQSIGSTDAISLYCLTTGAPYSAGDW